jgi:hypothetical protein
LSESKPGLPGYRRDVVTHIRSMTMLLMLMRMLMMRMLMMLIVLMMPK